MRPPAAASPAPVAACGSTSGPVCGRAGPKETVAVAEQPGRQPESVVPGGGTMSTVLSASPVLSAGRTPVSLNVTVPCTAMSTVVATGPAPEGVEHPLGGALAVQVQVTSSRTDEGSSSTARPNASAGPSLVTAIV